VSSLYEGARLRWDVDLLSLCGSPGFEQVSSGYPVESGYQNMYKWWICIDTYPEVVIYTKNKCYKFPADVIHWYILMHVPHQADFFP